MPPGNLVARVIREVQRQRTFQRSIDNVLVSYDCDRRFVVISEAHEKTGAAAAAVGCADLDASGEVCQLISADGRHAFI